MNKVTITVSGRVGVGKSALCGEIEIMCRALGLQVEWAGGQEEKNLTHADWTEALEMYRPEVTLVEQIEQPASSSPAMAAEPVAWRSWRDGDGYGLWDNRDEAEFASAHDFEPEPLYAAPQPAQADAREGLTDEQIETLAHRRAYRYRHGPDSIEFIFNRHCLLNFARALLQGANHE